MSYKKILVVILGIVIFMFGLMLTTSYAWYSFSAGSTTFNAVTSSKDIEVTFLKGEYINNTVAVPIENSAEVIDQYSDKHQFIVRTRNNTEDNEIMVKVSLVDIAIDNSLRVSDFKVELYYQGSRLGNVVAGNQLAISGATTKELGSVVLDDVLDNNFEIRVYLLDNNKDQSNLMNKNFKAKIQVDVLSRLKTNITDWESPDIYVSSITIDGNASDHLPTEGLYEMQASCTKGSNLTWDKMTKTITYGSGSKVNDECSLVFTKSTDRVYLNTVAPGSYVRYVGTNGCDGKSCEGQNANYVNDNEMGYCSNDFNTNFLVNGWRIGYIKDGTPYLISAGAPECVLTYGVAKLVNQDGNNSLSTNYYYGSGYTFDKNTGLYTLTGVTSSRLSWSSNYQSIIDNTPYTCKSTSSTNTCSTMYQVISYSSATQGKMIPYRNFVYGDEEGEHRRHLSQVALTYCNKEYAYGGVCNENSAWAMNGEDFEAIVGKPLNLDSCFNTSGDVSCGYRNDLINNGGRYWIARPDDWSPHITYAWFSDYNFVYREASNYNYGIRPILRLQSSITVIGGSGTYTDPYIIENLG